MGDAWYTLKAKKSPIRMGKREPLRGLPLRGRRRLPRTLCMPRQGTERDVYIKMNERRRKCGERILSLCLTAALLMLLLPALLGAGGMQASALDYSKMEKGLNRWSYYFLRTVSSIAVKDAYDTGVLASITAGQAVYEGGLAGYPISIIAQNHFGIKAYSDWGGKVFTGDTYYLYNSYADAAVLHDESYLRRNLWRAYDSWEEGIADHSALFHGSSRYLPVLQASNYKEAAYAIQDSGYAGESSTYAGTLIGHIERYGLEQLDDVSIDSNGVYGMIMDRSRATLDAGETLTLKATAYPAPTGSISVTWKSDRPEVATVDSSGRVTALRQGYTLITAEYNGKEAACVVEVDANAYSIDRSSPYIYSKPDLDSSTLGRLAPGQPVKVISKKVYTGPDGTEFYAASASPNTSDGEPVSGYVKVAGLYTGDALRLAVGTEQTVLYLGVGDSHTIPITVYAEELQGQPIEWSSSNEEVVTVNGSGDIQCRKEGVSVISVTIGGRLALTVTVCVGSASLGSLYATAAVYLRDKPTTDGSTILGLIPEGQEVKLVADNGDGWLRILAVIGGHMMEGYSYGQYYTEKAPSSSPGVSATPPPGSGTSPTVTYRTGRVDVDDSLNVRASASTSGAAIAKLKGSAEVVVLETVSSTDESYPTWYHIRFTLDGQVKVGYVASDFIVLTGSVTETVDSDFSSVYSAEGAYLTGITPGTTLSGFRAGCTISVRVYRADGTELAGDALLRTGDAVYLYDGDAVSSVRFAAVKGDLDGDGAADATDYMLLKRAVLGTYELQGASSRAALLTGQPTPEAADYMLLKRAVLGTYKLS